MDSSMPVTADTSLRTRDQMPATEEMAINKTIEINIENQLPLMSHNMADVDRNRVSGQQNHDISGPGIRFTPAITTTPKPFQRISGIQNKQKINENRIHFPNDNFKDQRVDPIASQPLFTDSSPLTSRPLKPMPSVGNHLQQNASKFRLKPGPAMPQMVGSQSPLQSPLGSPHNPNLRLPPFLLHSHSSGNHQTNRHKINTASAQHSQDVPNKTESNAITNNSLVVNKGNDSSNSSHYSNILTSDPKTYNNSSPVVIISSTSTSTPVSLWVVIPKNRLSFITPLDLFFDSGQQYVSQTDLSIDYINNKSKQSKHCLFGDGFDWKTETGRIGNQFERQ